MSKHREGNRDVSSVDARNWPGQLLVALAHEMRWKILWTMRPDQESSPRGISREISEPLGHVSYHMRVLHRLGVVSLVRTKSVRGATQHFYRLSIEQQWALGALGLDSGSRAGSDDTRRSP
jgi:predicted transcriptional regulator